MLQQNFGIAADDHQQIVEVVRDSAGEPSHGFHFLGLPELLFQRAPLGDILSDDFQNLARTFESAACSSA